jgi:hypothetical protein
LGDYLVSNRFEHISILDPLDVQAWVDELRLLKDGWLEGDGIAPAHDALDWLSQAFSQHYSDELPYPYLYPTAEGNVRVEWPLEPNEITVEFDLSTRRMVALPEPGNRRGRGARVEP